MQKIDALYLRKYLVSKENFVEVIMALFGDVVQVAGFSGLRLSQAKADGELVPMVEKGRILEDEETLLHFPIIVGHVPVMYVTACCGNVGFGNAQLVNLANIALAIQSIVAKEVYSTSVAQPEPKEEPVSETVKEPVEEKVEKVEEVEEKPEETVKEPVEEVKEQPVVTVVADVSVEELYEGVFSIMNKVPAGFAVLDNKKGEVLYMNKMAEETIPAQNAMGAALAIYEEKGQNDVGEVQDEDSGLWYDISFVPVKWTNGDEVLMSAAIDIKK